MKRKKTAFRFDRDHYIQLLQSQGKEAALNEFHRDLVRLEHECFEGRSGYSGETFQEIQKLRDFSRELWDWGGN